MKENTVSSFLAEDYFSNYYLLLKSDKDDLLINRKDKKAALNAYSYYMNLGKEIEWKGKWNGHQFVDTSITPIIA